jgi:pyrroloquinoline quinone biosynthesis protein D
MIERASVVRLAPHARLRFDRHRQEHMLLYPERGIVLSETAAAVVALIDGTRDVTAIVDALAAKYDRGDRAAIAGDVLDLLRSLASRGLVIEVAP